MILSDRTIADCIDDGKIGVDPEPGADQIQPASLDIRIGGELFNLEHNYSKEYEDGERMRLSPGVPYLGTTKETISLPNDIAAQLSGRSSVGRMFITVHQTAGWIDPGYEGEITLEIYNFSSLPTEIEVGDRVGQLTFFPLDRTSAGYDGRYQGQSGPTKVDEEWFK